MLLLKWRNVLILKDNLIPALSQPTASITKSHFASIHSTPTASDKWKNKWNDDVKRFQQPSKSYAKYAIRQKRADAKRALKDLLFKTGASRASLQDEKQMWEFDLDRTNGTHKKRPAKSSARNSRKSNHEKMRRKFRRESFSEDDGPETMFQAKFGNRWYTRSFNESSFRKATFGFEWREHLNDETHNRGKKWDAESDADSDNECGSMGSCHDRMTLGLPASGPLSMEDVKKAFRMSALKWHPDKHQGSSQVMAEEKFKVCVNSYKSLCDALT